MYPEKHVFLPKQGGTCLAYDCTEVTAVPLENQGHDLKQNSYGIKYSKHYFWVSSSVFHF